jgi:hypothetical protein
MVRKSRRVLGAWLRHRLSHHSEGELAERPLLADLTAETGARPVILRAKTLGEACGAVATILFSLRAPSLDFVGRVERYLVRAGAQVEILGHAQPTA